MLEEDPFEGNPVIPFVDVADQVNVVPVTAEEIVTAAVETEEHTV
jgi:hypothetical protein